jgi:hypothetical protein
MSNTILSESNIMFDFNIISKSSFKQQELRNSNLHKVKKRNTDFQILKEVKLLLCEYNSGLICENPEMFIKNISRVQKTFCKKMMLYIQAVAIRNYH